MEIVGNLVAAAGMAFILLGMVGVFKFRHFYPRILVAGKVDTVGTMTLIAGIAIKHGAGFFSLKLLLLAGVLLLLNPLATHIVAHCAYISGYPLEENPGEDRNGESG